MKKSEELVRKGNAEENDLIAMGYYNKALREERSERFNEHWLDQLGDKFDVTHSLQKGCFTFVCESHGTLDYYPKANKVLVRKQNKWIKPGLRWLIKTFNLNEKQQE